jgi:acetyl esterase/lipase
MSCLAAACFSFLLALAQVPATAESHAPSQPKAWAPPFSSDNTEIAPDGTAYIQRIVPIPSTISAQARKWLARPVSPAAGPSSLAEWRAREDRRRRKDGSIALRKYPARVAHGEMAGVPVTIVIPPTAAGKRRDFVLIDVHGGAFETDCCSLVESIPLANLLGAEVIAVHYRMPPEHPFPAGIDDVIAVYRAVLKNHPPGAVAIYGTSSGAEMTGEIAMALKHRHLPEPGALGFFSGTGDFSLRPDSRAFFTLDGLRGKIDPNWHGPFGVQRAYIGAANPADPLVSPMRGDLSGLPPTLFLTGTRDAFLGDVSLFDRAMLRAGDETQLVVFDAMPHAFWVYPDWPESDEAYLIMARFFERHLR